MQTADFDGAKVVAFDLTESQWEAVRAQCHHPDTTPLHAPATGDPVMCKRRRDTGTKFFACFPGGHDGFTEPETIHHVRLKKIIRNTAKAMGYQCDIEHVHHDDEGKVNWVADTYIERPGRRPLAIEVQWSAQTDEKFAARTERYRKDGVDCVWLDRKLDHGHVEDYRTGDLKLVENVIRIPLQQVGDDQYKIRYSSDWHEIGDLVANLLDGNLGAYRRGTDIDVYAGKCWKCGKLIATWALNDSEMFPESGVPRVEEQYARNVGKYLEYFPINGRRAFICVFADRYTKMSESYYRAFVCPDCGAVQGDFYRFMEDEPVATFAIGRGRDEGEQLFGAVWSDGVPAWESRTVLYKEGAR